MTVSVEPLSDQSHSRAMTFTEIVTSRHSSRRFLPSKPIPREILQRALTVATHSPSNFNNQPWRLYLLSGAALDRLNQALVTTVQSGVISQVPPIPKAFQHFSFEAGAQIFGEGLGIARDDLEGRKKATLRNYDFFGAPTAAIVCIDKLFLSSKADILSVGMYLQTFLLALTEEGVGSCAEVSVAGYPDVIREAVGIPEELDIICGVAIGYEDESSKVNHLRINRVSVDETTVVLED